MDLTTCMQKTTYRQYLAWQEWLDEQWNEPNLVCQYIMHLTAKVHNLFAKTPVDGNKFKLKFVKENAVDSDREYTEAEKAVITMRAKSRWGMITGLFGRKKAP